MKIMSMDEKESYIESELYRVIKNVVIKKPIFHGTTFVDVKDRMKVDHGEADIVIFGESKGKPVKFVIETKKRQYKYSEKLDPYSVTVVGQALGYAAVLDAQFIATTNGDVLVLFDAYKKGTILQRQVGEQYKVEYSEQFAVTLLEDISKYLIGQLKLLDLGQAFVERLKYFHKLITPFAFKALREEIKKNPVFENEYRNWIEEQGFRYNEKTHETIAEQVAYLLMNRILFHKTLEVYRKDLDLVPLKSFSEEEFSPNSFINLIENCFSYIVNNVDYEAVFQIAQVLDNIPISPALAEYLNDFIRDIEQYNLAEIDRDVIGDVYQNLITPTERRRLGQYYTPKEVCDLIVKLCVRSPTDKVIDPGCGSGGFLVSTYQRLSELMGKRKTDEKMHNKILEQIYGIDINQFASHVSVINLTIRDMIAPTHKVNIHATDFFKVSANQTKLALHKKTSLRGNKEEFLTLKPEFDAVVANPPYTRQDEIGNKKYMDSIRNVALTFYEKRTKRKMKTETIESRIPMSTEAGIYTYFFTHSTHFLKEKGMMGYIVSNSWLDVKFGKYLQKFFLDNFKIKTIIDFDKRVFTDASVNTVIIILQKLSGKEYEEERDNNIVKFIRIKKPISTEEISELVEISEESVENDKLRLVLIKQKELYKNQKWGTYLKAPEIYYKSIKNKKITRLKYIAEVGVGYVTLANDFFIIHREQAERLGIESRFLKQSIEPRQLKFLDVTKTDTNKYMLIVNESKEKLKGTNVLRYIINGEKKEIVIDRGSTKGKIVIGYNNLPALSTRKLWYSLGKKTPGEIFLPRIIWERWYAVWNKDSIYAPHTLYQCSPKKKSDLLVILGILNSSLTSLLVEILGQTVLGEGALGLMKHNFDEIPVINPEKLSSNERKSIAQAFLVIVKARRNNDKNAEEMARQTLDKTIFNVLGFTSNEQQRIFDNLNEMKGARKRKVEPGVMVEHS